jgi:hypothetical protein
LKRKIRYIIFLEMDNVKAKRAEYVSDWRDLWDSIKELSLTADPKAYDRCMFHIVTASHRLFQHSPPDLLTRLEIQLRIKLDMNRMQDVEVQKA